MKKLALLLVCGILLNSVPAGAANINVFADSNAQNKKLMIKYDLGSVRKIIEAVGADIDWDKLINSFIICKPTSKPTVQPTQTPTVTYEPTSAPTAAPTATAKPTSAPTAAPTVKPTVSPTQSPSQSETAMEQEVLRLVNEERAKNGLNALTWAEDLAKVARAHSSDMINRGFFSHTNPDGESPFDRLKNAGISYRSAAENIAYGQKSAADVMNSWMNSSGHRANILNANLREIGVGAVKDSKGTIYWTQVFVTR